MVEPITAEHTQPIVDSLDAVRKQTGYGRKRVFADWVYSIRDSLGVDDDSYMDRIAKYEDNYPENTTAIFKDYSEAFGHLVKASEQTRSDVLGRVYEIIGGPSGRFGQYFTPPPLCSAMVQITGTMMKAEGKGESQVERTVDPTCGSARFLLADSYHRREVMPEQSTEYLAQDIDPICAAMATVNFGLHGLNGYVIHGDSLKMEPTAAWEIQHTWFHNGVIQQIDPSRFVYEPQPESESDPSEEAEPSGDNSTDEAGPGKKQISISQFL